MNLRLARLRDQLVTQIILGILCDDLSPGERLPSTRQLARRFRLHPNTVSAAYRRLQKENWIEPRRGSGVYVRQNRPETSSTEALLLDRLIAEFFRSARGHGIPLGQVRTRVRHWLELQPPDHFLLIEPDEELRQILLWELLSPDADLLTLHIRPVGKSLAAYLPAPSEAIVGIASRWSTFLNTARTMLIAAGFHPDCLVLRDASKPNWQRGLKDTAAVVCDSLTARDLNGTTRVLPFSLLSESCLKELKEYEQSIRSPLAP